MGAEREGGGGGNIRRDGEGHKGDMGWAEEDERERFSDGHRCW